MEDVNGLNEASQTLHDSANSPGHPLVACPTAGCQTAFNTYEVLINRVNTSAEYLEFIMDGTVESTITEASVGTTAWQDAIDHGFFILWTWPWAATIPTAYVAARRPHQPPHRACPSWRAGLPSTRPQALWAKTVTATRARDDASPGTATATGQVTGYAGDCLQNLNGNNTADNVIVVGGCNGAASESWQVLNNGNLNVQGGCLDVAAGGKTSGTNVDWYPCNGTGAQGYGPIPTVRQPQTPACA